MKKKYKKVFFKRKFDDICIRIRQEMNDILS